MHQILCRPLLIHLLLFPLCGDDWKIMWKLSDGVRLVTSGPATHGPVRRAPPHGPLLVVATHRKNAESETEVWKEINVTLPSVVEKQNVEDVCSRSENQPVWRWQMLARRSPSVALLKSPQRWHRCPSLSNVFISMDARGSCRLGCWPVGSALAKGGGVWSSVGRSGWSGWWFCSMCKQSFGENAPLTLWSKLWFPLIWIFFTSEVMFPLLSVVWLLDGN